MKARDIVVRVGTQGQADSAAQRLGIPYLQSSSAYQGRAEV